MSTRATTFDATSERTEGSDPLLELARVHGVQPSYVDIEGARRVADREALVAVLAALGVDIDAPDRAAEPLASSIAAVWRRIAEPVVVVWDGRGSIVLRIPSRKTDAPVVLSLTLESGETREHALPMAEASTIDAAHIDGERFVALRVPLPGPLPLGYHRFCVTVGEPASALATEGWLFSAPTRAFTPDDHGRDWGVFAPLYALGGEGGRGVGHLGDLRELLKAVKTRGGALVGTLPLLAAFLEEPFEPSPYAPASRLAYNELFLDLSALPERELDLKVRAAIDQADVRARIEGLDRAQLVDYRAHFALVKPVLDAAAAAAEANPKRRAALESLPRQLPHVEGYARFRAAVERRGTPWTEWPDALRNGPLPDREVDRAAYARHRYAQLCLHEQLTTLAQGNEDTLGLYLDLPVGVSGISYDVWAHPRAFVRPLCTGAPPDLLFAGGQNWAFPPPHPEAIRADGYRHFIDVLRAHLRYARVLRIDHVMALHRLYVIPMGRHAKEGLYVRYRADELWAIVCLESHRARALVVGEDLGTVPDEVRHAMDTHAIARMHVVQYEAEPDPAAALPRAPAHAIASLNTHDMPPFTAFWRGTDIEERRQIGFIDDAQAAAERHGRAAQRSALRSFLTRTRYLAPDADAPEATVAALEHLAGGPARIVLVTLSDLWGETAAQNMPGTLAEHPNWRRRFTAPLPQLLARPEVDRALRAVDRARKGKAGAGAVRHDVSRLTDQDIYLFNEGTHSRIHEKLGAHPMQVAGQPGTYFGVWAPSATYVSVIGDFNRWDRGAHALAPRAQSGIWEGFIPGVEPGTLYKLHVSGPRAWSEDKADPMALMFEPPPRTAAVVCRPELSWSDDAWLAERGRRQGHDAPIAIYEVHLGSWMRVPEEGNRPLGYREIAPKLAAHVHRMGFTHVELMPIMEHPFYGSWGYQTTGYFAPTSRYGSPADFAWFMDYMHREGIGVILDWVPSHFPRDAHGLAYFDGTHLYEHADPRQGYHPDWQSNIFNYGRHEVQSFLVSSAMLWLQRYHADGLRVDAVASMLYLDYSRKDGEWIPNQYGGNENLAAIDLLRKLNETSYREEPSVQTYAEESTAWPMVSRPTHVGGLGFGFKWDMGWMHDTLAYMQRDPVHRTYHQGELTFRAVYAFHESYVLALSHDEVVHGKGSLYAKMPGDAWQRCANLRLLYGYQFTLPGKKLLFQGCEIGQHGEWNHEQSVDWHLLHDPLHAGLLDWVGDIARAYREIPALHELDHDPAGFEWIDFSDAQNSVLAFIRRDRRGGMVVAVLNFTPVPRHGYRVGVPTGGTWREVLNSDAQCYGGSGMGNNGAVDAEDIVAHGRSSSISLVLPPLGVLLLRPDHEVT